MSYYMRFLATREADTDLTVLERALNRSGAPWRLLRDAGGGEAADLKLGRDLLGEVEINRPGDGTFEEEMAELAGRFGDAVKDDPRLAALDTVTAIVAVRVLYQGRELQDSIDLLEPFWETCFAALGGILQVDDDGLYDRDEGYTPEDGIEVED